MFHITTEPFVLLYNLVYSIHMIVLPQLVLKKSCNQLYNSTICNDIHDLKYKSEQDIVQKHAALWIMALLMSTLLPSLFTVLIWGPVTDIIGRKRAIAIPPIFLCLQSLIYLLNCTKFMSSPPSYLIFGAMVTSVYGDFQGAYAIAYSYLADVTEKSSQRTMRMGILEGIMFISGAPAGIISGFLLQRLGFGPVFIATACTSLLMFIYVFCILPPPEKLKPKTQSLPSCVGDSFSEARKQVPDEETPIMVEADKPASLLSVIRASMNPLVHLKMVYSVIMNSKARCLLVSMLISFGLSLVSICGELYITVLFVTHHPFTLSPEQIGYYMAFMSVARGLGAMLLPQIAIRCFKLSDCMLVLFGLLSQTSNYILVALSNSKMMLYLSTISGIGIGLATSGIRSIITKQVSDESHGSILASIEFLDVFGGILGNVMANGIYNGTVSYFPGMAFFVLGTFSASSFVIVLFVWFCCRPEPENENLFVEEQ